MSETSVSPYEIIYNGNTDRKFDYIKRAGPFTGTATFPNEDTYTGEYNNKQRNGTGVYTWSQTGAIYTGSYLNNEKSGYGKFQYPDGSVYIGYWSADKRHGTGIYHYSNGDSYSGEWLNDLKHGNGTYIYIADGTELTGKWLNGQFINGDWAYYESQLNGELFKAEINNTGKIQQYKRS